VNFLLLVVGMVLGYVSRHWSNRAATLIALSVVIALVWGAVFADGIVAGTLWALLNVGVGVAIAAGIRWTLDRAGDGPIGG
jgi:uncharacterized membrane protein